MGGKPPGPTCTHKYGQKWIDKGTMCRNKSLPPGRHSSLHGPQPKNPLSFFGPAGVDVTSSGHITKIMRRIQLVPQRSELSCWLAAATMVLGYPPSVTLEMVARDDGIKGGGINLADESHLQTFIKQNGFILYPMSKWSLEGIENRLRTRSAFMHFADMHVRVVAGIEINHSDPKSSQLIIYDPEPVGLGRKTKWRWGDFLDKWTNFRASIEKMVPEGAELFKKRGWFGTGTYFLHR